MRKQMIAGAIISILSATVMAEAPNADTTGDNPSLASDLMAATGGKMKIESVSQSPLVDPKMITLEDGTELHLSKDKKHFVVGNLFKLENGKIKNVTGENKAKRNVQELKNLPDKALVTFEETGEYIGQIYVFTDTTCQFCKKLHREVPQLNAEGIRVNYLAWPRGPEGTAPYDQAVKVMCSENPKETLDAMKKDQQVNVAPCSDHTIELTKSLGTKLGLGGTPFVVFENGETSGGYSTAYHLKRMVERINMKGSKE